MIETVSDSLVKVVSGQKIITDRGYMEVGEDYGRIFSYKGEYKNIIKVSEVDEVGEYYEIVVNGLFLGANVVGDNQVLIYRGKREDRGVERLRWVPASEVRSGDMVVFNSVSRVPEEGVVAEYADSDGLATFLGYYALEGFINNERGKIVFHVEPEFSDMEREIRQACEKVSVSEMEAYTYMGEKFLSVDDPVLMGICEEFGDKNKERVIPEEIMGMDIKFLKEFVGPFLKMNKDRRGSYFRPSASLELFLGYKRIFMRIGAFANVYFCRSKDGKFTYYAFVMNKKELNSAVNFDGVERDNWFKTDGLVYMRVDGAERKDGKTKVYDMVIEGEGNYCKNLVFCR